MTKSHSFPAFNIGLYSDEVKSSARDSIISQIKSGKPERRHASKVSTYEDLYEYPGYDTDQIEQELRILSERDASRIIKQLVKDLDGHLPSTVYSTADYITLCFYLMSLIPRHPLFAHGSKYGTQLVEHQNKIYGQEKFNNVGDVIHYHVNRTYPFGAPLDLAVVYSEEPLPLSIDMPFFGAGDWDNPEKTIFFFPLAKNAFIIAVPHNRMVKDKYDINPKIDFMHITNGIELASRFFLERTKHSFPDAETWVVSEETSGKFVKLSSENIDDGNQVNIRYSKDRHVFEFYIEPKTEYEIF